eukprot:TRINITY_DN4957_c0_g1_i2.p1 TRINITY_DN4957_c0_g1~~TRINITY_DN4957_c0_g1_i2.p1  ORF type:complete len:547 (+),score=49.04 TRINITY_DN4957_c0_g1_i2:99-1739(+)
MCIRDRYQRRVHGYYVFVKRRELGAKFKELFMLHKVIIKNCGLILLDCLQLVQILIVMVLMVQFPSLCKRLYRVYKKMQAEKKVISDIQKASKERPTQGKTLMSLSYNVLATVLNFLDIHDILRFEQLTKKARDVTKMPRVWRNLYNSRYTKWAPLPKDLNNPDYKHYCIKGNNTEVDARRGEYKLTEEMRDYLLGPRFIICEELFYSLLKIPHLFMLPVKLLAYLLYRTRKVLLWIERMLRGIMSYEPINLKNLLFSDGIIKDDEMESCSFFYVQNCLLGTVLVAFNIILCLISYAFSRINYFIAQLTSGFSTHPIPPDTDLTRNPYNPPIPLPRYYNVCQFFQIITFPIVIFNWLVWIVAPPIIWYKLGYDFMRVIFGPYFVNAFFLAITVCTTITTICLCNFYAVNYNPFQAMRDFSWLVTGTVRDIIYRVAQGIARAFKRIMVPFIAMVLRCIISTNKFVFNFVKQIIKFLLKAYFYPVILFTKIGKPLGIIWEVATLILGIPWIFWPLLMPWYLGDKLLYIPAVILTAVLVVAGRYHLKDL